MPGPLSPDVRPRTDPDATEIMTCPREFSMDTDDTLTVPDRRPRITKAPPLRRISSACEPERDILQHGCLHPHDIRKEYEALDVVKHTAARPEKSFHHRYFLSQTHDHPGLCVPIDPLATERETVVIDTATYTIFEAYLLRTNISKNANEFHRQQVVFSSTLKTYSVIVREGRIGFPGRGRRELESSDLKPAVAKFFRLFQEKTGLGWYQRHVLTSREGYFVFVELDYHRTVPCPRELPNYNDVDADVNDEVRILMELVLHGGPVQYQKLKKGARKKINASPLSAPYKYISRWAIFLALKTIEAIWKHLESGHDINWRAILRASSRYRSQMPLCAGQDRPPVVSSYRAIFIELKFLHSLWPRQETADMLTEINLRGSRQLRTWNIFTQPMYHAYSSLKHGFRRLTESSSLEFRELKDLLEKSCHRSHYLTLELQDVYRLFIKSNLPNPYNDWIESKKGVPDKCGEGRLLLWHGTPVDSLLGILEVGLQIRRRGANFTGAMFGDGIYLADASSKSAGFCKPREWDGEAVLFLCEADVGEQRMKMKTSLKQGHEHIKESGGNFRCIEGLGRTGPRGWKQVGWEMGGLPNDGKAIFMPDVSRPYGPTRTGGCLGFNEYVVYDNSHVTLRYLFRVRVNVRRE